MIRKELIITSLICLGALFASCKSPGGGGPMGGGGGGPMGGGGCKKCQNPNRNNANRDRLDENGNPLPDEALQDGDGEGIADGFLPGINDPVPGGGIARSPDSLLDERGTTPRPGGTDPSLPGVGGAGAGGAGGAVADPSAAPSGTAPQPGGTAPDVQPIGTAN